MLGITLALKYPGIRGLVGALTIPLLRDTTLQTYFEHLDGLKCPYQFLKTENKLVFPNGSEILFRHLEDPNVLKSLNLGFVEIEEMSDIPYDTFQVLLSRLRQSIKPEWKEKGFRHRLFGHTNPQNGKGWIYQDFVKVPKDGYRRVIAPSTQNKHLPDGYLKLLKDSFNEDYYNRMVMGNDDSLDNTLMTRGFDKEKQIDSGLNIDKRYPIHITCDFNVDPMCWYIAQHYDNNIYYLFEVVINNTTTNSAAEIVCDLLKDYRNHPIIINGDASGNSETTKGNDYIFMRNAFKRNNFENVDIRVLNRNTPIKYRIDCWNAKIQGPDKQPHIFIHPQCKKLIYNIENLEIKPGTSKLKLPTPQQIKKDDNLKYLGHPFDAASYLIVYYYPVKDIRFDNYVEPEYKEDIFNGKYDDRII